ncbi:MAG: lytic murein transglycosylase [Candidatus Nealsonbacteria bacterium]
MSKLLKFITFLTLVSVLAIPRLFVFANPSPSEERQALEEELEKLEEQIAGYDKNIAATAQEKKTLENTIASLKNKIKKLDLQISQSNIIIKDLGFQIDDTEISIDKTSLKIDEGKTRLAAILQKTYEEDQRPLVEILISEGLSDFFDNLVALEALNVKNRELLTNIKSLKFYLEDQKQSLDDEKGALEKQVEIQALQRQQSTATKQEQDSLLKLTEAEYQKQLTEKTSVEKQAQAIRGRIFELIGIPEAPTFGEAYEIAKFVSERTGVRPALLLAVLTQESNIGKNVGQCYLKDTTTGNGIRVNGTFISKVMKPSRDVQPFLQITESLGRDYLNTPVSCPIPSVGGYGGAMGPAQFIPSTWMIYKNRVAELKGSSADPWNISDAFLAAAVYLSDVGATKQTHDYEWCAALSYFAGSCSLSNQIRYEFYGDSVMALAAKYEQDIKNMQ